MLAGPRRSFASPVEIPLPWERLLWSGRPAFAFSTGERYILTDVRLVRLAGAHIDELLVHDIGDIHHAQSRPGRMLGLSTVTVHSRNRWRAPIVLSGVRRGPQLAALLEWLPGEPRPTLDAKAVAAAMAWNPRTTHRAAAETISGVALVLAAVFGVAIGLHGKAAPP